MMNTLYKTLKSLMDEVVEVPRGTMNNHITYLGVKHTFGNTPKKIYSQKGVTAFTEKVEMLFCEDHGMYERITGVYKR